MSQKLNEGDTLSVCDQCGRGNVIYDGKSSGICNSCGIVFDVSFDDEEVPPPPPPPPPPLPPKQIQSIKKVTNIGSQSINKIQTIKQPMTDNADSVKQITSNATKPVSENGANLNEKTAIGKQNGIPDHMMSSRPWRWAFLFMKTGNPYRQDSKNYGIFDIIQNSDGLTVSEIVVIAEKKYGEKLSYLLTVYEVLSQCLTAGLLVMDQNTRKITVCIKDPTPTIIQ